MTDQYNYPKLRWPIELRLEKIDNQELLVVGCPLGVTPMPLVLVGAVAPIVASFDGHSSFDSIAEKFGAYGIKPELIMELVTLLDNHLFLATPKFFAAEREAADTFLHSPVRPAALAGRGYSNSRETLRLEIDEYLKHGQLIVSPRKDSLVGVVSPHIDYRRGGVCYGMTYNYLRGASHDLYILIGTSHMFSERLFHLTKKDFENPLGLLKCDRNFVEAVSSRHGTERSFQDELLHKREHSLELQIPFLSHLHENPMMVPILVGSFHSMLTSGRLPSENEEYESFAASLAEALKGAIGAGRKVCVIAGVDMAHVGRQFGDSDTLSEEKMAHIAARDKKYIDAIVNQDKLSLFAHVAEDLDARRLCGFPTMYTVLDVFDRIGVKYRAELFDYRQAVDFKTECAVTFAGMGLYQ